MRFLRILIAIAIVPAIFYTIAPGSRPWLSSILAKASFQEVDCDWGALVRQPVDVSALVAEIDRLAASYKVVGRDEALGIVQIETPTRSYWVKEEGRGMDGRRLIGFLLAEQEYNAKGIPASAVRPGDVVLDVGAHIGTFTDLALRQGASKVIQLEPDPVNVECLRRNFKAEIEAGRVVLVPEGAWSKEDTIEFSTGVGNSGMGSMVLSEQGAQKLKVRVRPIDQMLPEIGVTRIDYLKMDIEGAERDALKGAEATLRRDKPRIHMDANHLPNDTKELPALLRGYVPGYALTRGNCEVTVHENAPSVAPHTIFLEAK